MTHCALRYIGDTRAGFLKNFMQLTKKDVYMHVLKTFKKKTFSFLFLLAMLVSADVRADQTSLVNPNVRFISSYDVLDATLMAKAITRNEFPGFYEDFLVLHCLLAKYRPFNLFEIGTCEGVGTMIIKNALGSSTVYSLDLPPNVPKEYTFLNAYTTGARCSLPYVQLFGDSMTYAYEKHYPLDAWFIDGEHDYAHVFYESTQALLSNPSFIFWHDTDIPCVFNAILDVFANRDDYLLYRISDTRISYAIKKNR